MTGWLATQAFVAVWVIFTIGYNLDTVGIRAINFGAIPQFVQKPFTSPDPVLSNGVPLRDLQWNFSNWMTRKVFTINDHQFVLPLSFRELGLELRFDQYWSMFAPSPLKDDGWFIFSGKLEDKSEIDLWTNEPVTFLRPQWLANKFPNYRWFKFMEKFLRHDPSQRGFHACIGNYYLRSWDRAHPKNHLVELNVYFVTEVSQPPYKPQTRQVVHIMRWCRNNECK